MKMFLQTETPVSPAWSSDELSPQKANTSGGYAADGGDLVERNLFCDEFDAAAILDGQSEIGDDGASGEEQHRQEMISIYLVLIEIVLFLFSPTPEDPAYQRWYSS